MNTFFIRQYYVYEVSEVSFLKGINRIHMVGIGGAGMCALARILFLMGYTVTGSDVAHSDNTKRLENLGIKVYFGHFPSVAADSDAVVYSAAIGKDDPELIAARNQNIPVMTRAQLFSELSLMHSSVFAVAGTHGKTTTTAMLTEILTKCGCEPTAVIGGHLPLIHGNGALGNGEIMVCEACEFARTFLAIKRDTAVVLNIDNDHLEQYGSMEGLTEAFGEFVKKSKTAVICGDDRLAVKCAENAKEIITFGFGENCDWRAVDETINHGCRGFKILKKGEPFAEIKLGVPGRHNVYNALAAAVCADIAGVGAAEISWGLNSFCGVSRRFEVVCRENSITVADDYAHHPKEIKAVLSAAKELGFNKITAVFQPFTYSRTRLLLKDFADALKIADRVILTEIMGGREENTYGVSSEELSALLGGVPVFSQFEKAAECALSGAKSGNLIITLGCGNIYKCARIMRDRLQGNEGNNGYSEE